MSMPRANNNQGLINLAPTSSIDFKRLIKKDKLMKSENCSITLANFHGKEVIVKSMTYDYSTFTFALRSNERSIQQLLTESHLKTFFVRYLGCEIDQTKHKYKIAMKYVPFGDLDNFTNTAEFREFSHENLFDLIKQIISCIHALHIHNIAHLDIKLANFFIVSKDPLKIKLGDYGNCKKDIERTDRLEPCGTAGYMAPEFLNNSNITLKADIFSLGMLIFYLVSQHSDRQNQFFSYDSGRQQCKLGYERPTISTKCPQEIKRLIESCWHKSSDQRPSAEELMRIYVYQSHSKPSPALSKMLSKLSMFEHSFEQTKREAADTQEQSKAVKRI